MDTKVLDSTAVVQEAIMSSRSAMIPIYMNN
jgi:hypothetical protein